jgi:hypothetical protein
MCILKDVEAVPYRRRKYEKKAMMQQLMLRCGPDYYQQMKSIDSNREKNQRPKQRTSLQGAWFMADDEVQSTQRWWTKNLLFRVVLIVYLVHVLIYGVLFTRSLLGTGVDRTE